MVAFLQRLHGGSHNRQAMRHHLGHNSEENKIVLGLGYYYYDHPEAWSQLSRTGLSLSAKDVDVLVVISTVVSIPSQSWCMTLPSNALMSEDRHAPNMAKVIMNKPERRANFSWFLFNVELTDVTRHCLTEGPFDRLKQFKEFYLNEARNGPPT
ncbi:hypothetical protein HPB51_028875 [Rhipicephalus microplus]|uniref:Uncharacterized protein n=1 Tax=Rhipicephalus microplus TaxID=6941 RepID=A0A9J6CVQ2_RHIMP|nr:hypothetical protein HPB51_028875 [Rhipicephalus microplus]